MRLILAVTTALSIAAASTASAERMAPTEAKVENNLTAVLFGKYTPEVPKSLDEIPKPIRERLRAHLIDRLGEAYLAKLAFAGGQIVDIDRLYKEVPEARNFKWTVFAYRLVFRMAAPDKGITAYFAAIELDKNGAVIKEIELPPVRRLPHKANFVPLTHAFIVAAQNGFDVPSTWAELSYDPKLESIIYRLLEGINRPGKERTIEFDAHNGEVVRIYDAPGSN